MSQLLDASAIAAIREASEGLMLDECVRVTHTLGPSDEDGNRPRIEVVGQPTRCRFRETEGAESGEGVLTTSAEVVLPAGSALENEDKIRVTARFGTQIPAEEQLTYEVVSGPSLRMGGVFARLRQVRG